MKIGLISDIHLDHYKDGTKRFCDDIDAFAPLHPADVMIVAGDIGDGRFHDQYTKLFTKLREHYAHVLAVTGNHDYYRSDFARTHHSLDVKYWGVPDNVHVLHRQTVEIEGRKFHGHAMWYRSDPLNGNYEHWMNDVAMIRDLKNWVYQENLLWETYLANNLGPGDIVVTHHLPHENSIDKQYKNSPLNRFFLCDMEPLIATRKPALWVHGHTHSPCDYQLHDTRVVCNPKGYPRERIGTYVPKIIEV